MCKFRVCLNCSSWIQLHHFIIGGNLRRAIRPILLVGQIFGVMPVIGITSHSANDLHFKWKSFRAIYSIIIALTLFCYTLNVALNIMSEQIDLFSFGMSFDSYFINIRMNKLTWCFLHFSHFGVLCFQYLCVCEFYHLSIEVAKVNAVLGNCGIEFTIFSHL